MQVGKEWSTPAENNKQLVQSSNTGFCSIFATPAKMNIGLSLHCAAMVMYITFTLSVIFNNCPYIVTGGTIDYVRQNRAGQ